MSKVVRSPGDWMVTFSEGSPLVLEIDDEKANV